MLDAVSMDCTEICPDIGACCRIFSCNSRIHDKDAVRKILVDQNLPFVEVGETEGTLITTCKNLNPDGLCSDYDARPETCRIFQPYTEIICCLFVGPPSPISIRVTQADLVNRYLASNIH